MNRSAVAWIAAGVAVAAGAFVLAARQAGSEPELLPAGSSAPTVAGATTGGGGQPVVVAFLSPSCEHCQRTAPQLAALADAEVVAVLAGTGDDDQRAALEQGLGPIELREDVDALKAYGVEAVPTVYVLRPDGTISDAWIGEQSDERMRDAVSAARGSPA